MEADKDIYVCIFVGDFFEMGLQELLFSLGGQFFCVVGLKYIPWHRKYRQVCVEGMKNNEFAARPL